MGRVLVVDDDEAIVEAVTLALEFEGYDVVATTKANEAYDLTCSSMPNVVLLDLLLSGIDGATIARRIKNNTKTKNIPIIIFSAHPAAKESVKGSADDFLSKPFDVDDMLYLIKKYSKNHLGR